MVEVYVGIVGGRGSDGSGDRSEKGEGMEC